MLHEAPSALLNIRGRNSQYCTIPCFFCVMNALNETDIFLSFKEDCAYCPCKVFLVLKIFTLIILSS